MQVQVISVCYFLNIGHTPTSNDTVRNETLLVQDRMRFSLDIIKQKIYEQLKQTDQGLTPIDTTPPFCKSLRCKCIFTEKDYFDIDIESQNFDYAGLSDADKQKPADVANACLTILNFLILDGHSNLHKNLDHLYEDAITSWDGRQHKADDIMVEIFYSSYKRLFAANYQLLKAGRNYTDKFRYDLPKVASRFPDLFLSSEINGNICISIKNCTESLLSLSNTWQAVIIVLDFPWGNLPLGTYLANYNHLLDKCVLKKTNFQTAAAHWRSNPQKTGQCMFSKGLLDLHNDLGLLLTQMVPGVNISLSLVDFVGLLGYSEQFDITAIKQHDYVETNKVLLPLYDWDRRENVKLAPGDMLKELKFILCSEKIVQQLHP